MKKIKIQKQHRELIRPLKRKGIPARYGGLRGGSHVEIIMPNGAVLIVPNSTRDYRSMKAGVMTARRLMKNGGKIATHNLHPDPKKKKMKNVEITT